MAWHTSHLLLRNLGIASSAVHVIATGAEGSNAEVEGGRVLRHGECVCICMIFFEV